MPPFPTVPPVILPVSPLSPTGFCGPAEVGPVCFGTRPAPDAFLSGGSPALERPFSSGALPYFGASPAGAPAAAPSLPPLDRELALSEYRNDFPAGMQPIIADLVRFQADFNVPISFRIASAQLSTGETVPQIYFFRTGDVPEIPAFRGGGGPMEPNPTGPDTAVGLTISTVGGNFAVVAFDRLLLKSLVDHGILPAEARMPVLFTSVMTTQYVLNRAGLMSTTPVESLRTMPTFMGFHILARLLLDQMNVEPGAASDVAGLTLASLPFLIARQSPMLADALAAANAGKGFELAGLSAEAATLRVGAAFARILGEIGLIDSAASAGDYDDNCRIWDLIRLSQDIVNQRRGGTFLASVFGSLMTAEETVIGWFDADFDREYRADLQSIWTELSQGSDDFGNGMNQSLIAIALQNTRPTGAVDGDGLAVMAVDMDGVRRDVAAFYQDERNSENIGNGYDLVDGYTAPMTASGVRYLIENVDREGNISDSGEFQNYLYRTVISRRYERELELERRSMELGLAEDVNGIRVSRFPADPSQNEAFLASLTPAQRDFVTGEASRLSLEIMQLALLEDVVDPARR
jgi:hypothetical protein